MKVATPWLILAGFIFLAQWIVPLSMVVDREAVMEEGAEFKFKIIPVDPMDPFRGRYMRIRINPSSERNFDWPENLTRGESLYVTFGENAEGFAKIVLVSRESPEGKNFLKVKVKMPNPRRNPGLALDYGINRYYMNETIAPEAETLVRERLRDGEKVWITARIHNGDAVVTGLFIDGAPLEDLVREARDNEG